MTRSEPVVTPPITLVDPLREALSPFPTSVHVVKHLGSGKYGCFVHAGNHGLACFESHINAQLFAGDFDLTGMAVIPVSFDHAREIAKDRPAPVNCLILLDNPDAPSVHFVR